MGTYRHQGVRALLALAAAGATVAAPAAQQANIKSGVEMVPLTVTVTDNGGKFVRGLTRNDFVVFEDGVAQRVAFFAGEDVPVDVALLVDTSSSMRPELPLVASAATGLVRALAPADRGAIVAVNDRAGIVQPFTTDRAQLEQAVLKLSSAGSTALYDGVYVVLREFERERRSTGRSPSDPGSAVGRHRYPKPAGVRRRAGSGARAAASCSSAEGSH